MSMFFIDPYRFDDGSDPYFADVSLLVHCDGTVGSSSFSDSGPQGLPVNAGSVNARVSNTQVKFDQSGVFSLSADSYLEVPVNTVTSNINFGATAWTVECFFYETTGSQSGLFGKQSNANVESAIFTFTFYCPFNGNLVGTTALIWAAPSQNAWHHLAVCRDGVNLYAFIDGVLMDSRNDITYIAFSSTYLNIGQSSQSRTQPFVGYMDEIRWTDGVCRYNADFAPPTEPFPNY